MKVFVLWVIIMVIQTGQNSVVDEFDNYLKELADEFKIEQVVAESLKLDQVVLLDTREREEYNVSHILGAIWVGDGDFEISKIDTIQRDKTIVLYCSVGYRSSKIAEMLVDLGYLKVRNLYGGIFRWANENRPLYFGDHQTNQIHVYNAKWGRFVTNPALKKVY